MNFSDDTNTKTNITLSVCANCGKEGSDITNTCNKCKQAKYCNAACKKKHRHKHKKDCERRVAELHDEALFKQPPPLEDCLICFLRMPSLYSAQIYMTCCGKVICSGCIHSVQIRDEKEKRGLCPFCRTLVRTSDKEIVDGYKKRIELNDTTAIFNYGGFYALGIYGLPQNYAKALELWHQAGKLGCAQSYYAIGLHYLHGGGVERDMKKATHYWEQAAIGGDVKARYKLGITEQNKGNLDKALKHWMIGVEGGDKMSLDCIKRFYKAGHATKDDYATALKARQAYLDEVKSAQREEAAAFHVDWTYY